MPQNRRLLKLRWPDAGIDKRAAYRDQPPFATPDCLNVQPEGQAERRLRGGSRPGLAKYAFEQISAGSNPIRMLSQVTAVFKDGYTQWSDDFTSSALSDVWSTPSWYGNAQPTITTTAWPNLAKGSAQCGAVRTAVSPALDTSQAYLLELMIVPDPATTSWAGTYSIFARMDNSSPAATTEGVVCSITMTGVTEAWTGALTEYNGGSPTAYAFTAGTGSEFGKPGILTMLINGNDISVYWQGTTVINARTVTAHSGSRIGFGLYPNGSTNVCYASGFRAQYYTDDSAERTRTVTVASANGELWRDLPWQGRFAQLTTTQDLASDRAIQAAERAQKLYIADHGDLKATGTDGVRGTANNKFDSATYTDWTTLGIDTTDDVLVISDAATGGVLINGTYTITSVAAGELTLGYDCATGAGATTCTFTIQRGPKIYDPVADTLTLWVATDAPTSQVPTGCTTIALYRDRISMTKDSNWFHSAAGDPLDWDYSSALLTGAVAGINADAGEIGETITAQQAFHDDYLLFGCRNSTWILRGDAKCAGVLGPLSRVVGAVSPDAITVTNENMAIFLTSSGLYGLQPGSEQYPTALSEQLPDDLIGMASSTHYLAVVFDAADDGAFIIANPNAGATTTHYWFDWARKSYWPFQIPKAYDPTKVHRLRAVQENQQRVLFGCKDGYIREFNRYATNDDGTAITSYLKIGPIRAGDDYYDGILHTLDATLSQNSGPVTWTVYVGDNHETAATTASAFMTGDWDDTGKQYCVRVQGRAGGFVIKLSNYNRVPWSIESLVATISATRQKRKY